MKRSRATALRLALLLAGVSIATPASAQIASERVLFEDFSAGLDRWEETRLDRRLTEYRIVTLDGDSVLESVSADASAALLLPLPSGPVAPGRLRWRWRVLSSLTQNTRETERKGDDYAARVFVLFGDGKLAKGTRTLAYAWAGRQPVGSAYPNPYISDVSTVVLQSGNDRAEEWVVEDRDLKADYERAFGEPATDVAAIAILVDTDDTDGTAMAWFDDLELWVAAAP